MNMINMILCFHGDYTQERKRENKETRNQANEIISDIGRCHRKKKYWVMGDRGLGGSEWDYFRLDSHGQPL